MALSSMERLEKNKANQSEESLLKSCEEIKSEFSFVCSHDQKFTRGGIKLLKELLMLQSEVDINLMKAFVYEQKLFPDTNKKAN